MSRQRAAACRSLIPIPEVVARSERLLTVPGARHRPIRGALPILERQGFIGSKQDSLPKRYVLRYHVRVCHSRVLKTVQLGKDQQVVQRADSS